MTTTSSSSSDSKSTIASFWEQVTTSIKSLVSSSPSPSDSKTQPIFAAASTFDDIRPEKLPPSSVLKSKYFRVTMSMHHPRISIYTRMIREVKTRVDEPLFEFIINVANEFNVSKDLIQIEFTSGVIIPSFEDAFVTKVRVGEIGIEKYRPLIVSHLPLPSIPQGATNLLC